MANSPSSYSRIGIIGLGLIGSAVAERLVGGSLPVLGWDINPERLAEAHAAGTEVALSSRDVFAACDRLLLSLPSHREVVEVIDACETKLRPGQCIIDTTTGDPESTRQVASRLASMGVTYLDATISGNSAQVRKGDVTVMVGGEASAYAACEDIFSRIGRAIFHTGPAGTGAEMKLVTNLVLGLNRAALAEGLVLAKSLHLDPVLTLRVMRASAAYSSIMDTKGERMIHGEFSPDARLSQHLKDVRLIVDLGRQANLPMPLSTVHQTLLEQAEAAGCGDLDNSAIIKVLEAQNSKGKSV